MSFPNSFIKLFGEDFLFYKRKYIIKIKKITDFYVSAIDFFCVMSYHNIVSKIFIFAVQK